MSEDEDEAPAPKVTDAPDTIWLVYGELDEDVTHAECDRDCAVQWCEDQQFSTDVRYVRADLASARIDEVAVDAIQQREAAIAEAVAAERERCAVACERRADSMPHELRYADAVARLCARDIRNGSK